MKKFKCRNSMLFDFCKILKTAAISFVLAGMFMFSSYAYAGENPTSGDPEGITGGWAVSSPESSQPIETYIMECTTPGTPSSASVSSVSCTSCTASWGASSCSGGGCSFTYYWSVGNSSHTYSSGYTARGTTTGLTASVTGLTCGTTYYLKVYAYNSCGVSGNTATSSAFTTSTCSTAPTSITGTTNVCSGSTTTTLTQSGGSAGSGGVWWWYSGSCGGTFVGSGSSLTSVSVTPGSTTNYYVQIIGTCNTTTCASTTVNVNTVPTAVTVTPATVNQCGGTAALNASGGTGGVNPIIYWQNTTSGGASTATPSISQTVSSSGTYYFRAKNDCGWGAQGSSSVTISPSPGAITSISGDGTVQCGGSVTLTAYGGSNATIYFQGTTSNGTATNLGGASVSVSSSGTYYFRAYNVCGWGTQLSATVTINTIPDAVSVSGAGTFCDSKTLTASGGGGYQIYFQGTTNNGTATDLGGASVSVSSSGTYYFRAYNSTGGCWGPQGSAAVIIINSSSAPTSISGTTTICTGNSTGLTRTGGSLGTGAAWYWYSGSCGGTFVASNVNSITVSPSTTTTYYVRAEGDCNTSGCASATVTVDATSAASESQTPASGSTVCAGTSVKYTGSGTGTFQRHEYQWNGTGGTWTNWNSNNPHTWTSNTNGTTLYVRSVYKNGVCPEAVSSPVNVTINSNPTAPTSVSVSPSTICKNTSTDYTLTYTGGDAGGSGGKFYWYEGSCGGTPVASTNNQVITRTLTSSTTYYGRWESNSCGNSACKDATVTVEESLPTYDGYSNVDGYTYYDGTNYWVKGGDELTIDIKHSDNVDVKTQYLTFCHDNCTPNGCGDAPHEIKSYNTDGSFTDWMANDSYLNITGTSIVAGGWGNTTITNRWTTEVSASCPDWDWYPYTYLYDWCNNGVGYTALGKWIRVDNTAPTRDVASVNDACWITNGTNEYTITIVSTEPRSGFGGPYGMMALVNYYSGETDAGGYFAWHPSSYVHTENKMACSGGGYVSKSSSWGGARIDLVSATTSTIGNQRTVTFTVRPHSDYLELNGTNKICMYTSDNCSNKSGWTEFATNFTSIGVPATPTGATEICTGGSATLTRGNAPPSGVTYYWQTSSTGESTTLGSGETLVDSPGSTTTYYVRPYSSSGCWGQASAGVTVTVSADPTAPSLNVATPASGNTVCVGATVSATFNAGSGGVDCGDEYQYTNGGSWSSYTPGTEITASTTGTNVIQIQTRRVCSGNGCDGAGGTWATKAQWTVVADPDVSASGATTICSGLTADLTSSGSNGTGTMSYQWQYYDGATWVNTGTNSNELTTQALAGTTDFRCQYSATGLGCTTATSNTVTVTVSTPDPESLQLGEDDYVWTGVIDTKWDDADNWISYNGSTFSIPGNVPAVTNDVFFTTYGTTCGTVNPEISSASGNCKDITIESGHELKMFSAQILNVQGNWKNNGTFTAGNGTVTFNGAAQQTVYAGTSNFNNLTLNNASGIKMTSDLTVGNVLNMTLGNIDAKTNDKVLILGTATDNLGTLEYTNGYVLGKMKRWFSNTTNSDTASGLFPLGVGINNRHLLVEYTSASSGGSLTAFFNEASMGWPETWMELDQMLVIPAEGECAQFIVTTLSDEGYWDVTPNGMTGGQYNISLTGGGIQTINNLCNLTALKREGSGEWYEDGDHVQPTGSTSAPVVKRVGASGWSNWGMGGGAYNPLPINLLSFNAACQNREVTINWTTATETNNDYFTIERSMDAKKWGVLTKVDGAGNSNALKYYTIRDDNPYDGISYYRLKQTDYNGQYEYFNPVSVRCDSEESTPIISYYPNPFTSEVVIDIHNLSVTKASLVIYDLLGNKVYENIFSMDEEINKKFTIDLNRLPVGVYIASFVSDEYSIVSRIDKQF